MKFPKAGSRREILLERRNKKMARSPHAYVRGNTAKYYEWLDAQHAGTLPEGPPIWICGDCHMGNLGPVADNDGQISLVIRDFDQTVIGNPSHDLVRLGLSLATAARSSSLPGMVTAHMLESLIEGYGHALRSKSDEPALPRPRSVKQILRGAARRSWKELARERIDDPLPSIPMGPNFWPLSNPERSAVEALFATDAMLELITRLKSRDADAEVKVLDAAYWVKGCSSLGLLRYAVLVGVGDDECCLVDIKEAVRPIAPRPANVAMPRDNGRRVIAGARNMSPALGERMLAQRFMEHAVFVRELMPQDLKLEIDTFSVEEASRIAYYLAHVVGYAHARQMDSETRRNWAHDLASRRSKTLNAPSWLWTSVVQLLAAHESGYLEHCRRYALSTSGKRHTLA